MKCDDAPNFEISLNKSDGIFLGRLEEIKSIVYNTTHQGEKTYFSGRFKVISSWKLIDKEYVWINLPNKETPCTQFEEGKTYLIYANQSGDELFITLDSRSAKDNTSSAQRDLKKLGIPLNAIKNGEFTLSRSPLYDISIALFIVIISAFLIYRWVKRSNKHKN